MIVSVLLRLYWFTEIGSRFSVPGKLTGHRNLVLGPRFPVPGKLTGHRNLVPGSRFSVPGKLTGYHAFVVARPDTGHRTPRLRRGTAGYRIPDTTPSSWHGRIPDTGYRTPYYVRLSRQAALSWRICQWYLYGTPSPSKG